MVGNEWTRGNGFLRALREESNEITEMLTLSVAIADACSRFDIEFGCTFVSLANGEWHDTSRMSPEVEQMDPQAQQRYGNQLARAMRYLDLRGQIVRNPTFPALVRFTTAENLH